MTPYEKLVVGEEILFKREKIVLKVFWSDQTYTKGLISSTGIDPGAVLKKYISLKWYYVMLKYVNG